ncbi:hypothetical protein [Paenibacillus sp. BR1-192]|uniref:hypothetical protein n=1 Tax=Paenibacillus sp. BR1-192 TaxID=3032287 RepID=UPI00240E63C5|nr:hypothetical protein [Paenibacillus sp. BR1-192]WFB60576.1 hypothetical protein P0X86_10385 [Paenibacillus sp. BR1-192]
MSNRENKAQPQPAPRYTKEQIVSSKRFTTSEKDILTGLLAADKMYTLEEAQGTIESFKRKEV